MITIDPFDLERYFARHEFSARYLLSSSDCESPKMVDLLSMANEETRTLWDELKLGYTESQGHPLLRDEIAKIYEDMEPDDLVVCVPEEGIFLIMHVLLRPGDHVVTTFPGYQSLYEIARSLGCSVSKWEPIEAEGWVFDLAHLKRLLRPETRLVVVNFPHNPTGHVPPINDYLALIDLIRERGIYLFSDEMYRFLERPDGSTLPSACDHYERAFSLFGMSKTFGLPGLRIGWVVSRDKEKISRLVELKDYTTICNSAPSEVLALVALQNRGTIINQQKKRINTNLGILDSFMESFSSHFHWARPIGGSVCFPRMLKVDSTLNFCERLVVEMGILLVPSRMFQYGDHHIRIGFGRDNFQESLNRFSDYLQLWKVT